MARAKNRLADDDEVLDPSISEDESATTAVRYSIGSYGVDYPVDALVKRLSAGEIIIPKFQRGFVWNRGQASRFVESLLLGLPVPGIFLSKDSRTNEHYVIDGQQRLLTLQAFYDGLLDGKEFELVGVSPEFVGVTYKTLKEQDRRGLDNAVIHATIVKQEKPEDDQSSIYLIFERLNTGGTPLSSQEIRSCVYHGPFIELLKQLNDNEAWRTIFGPISKRAKDQEMILRFFALYYDLKSYERPMYLFLSGFLDKNRYLKKYSKQVLTKLLSDTAHFSVTHLGADCFRPERALNASVLDALFVAVAKRLSKGRVQKPELIRGRAKDLLKTDEFITKCILGTTNTENVVGRIELAQKAFNEVP